MAAYVEGLEHLGIYSTRFTFSTVSQNIVKLLEASDL